MPQPTDSQIKTILQNAKTIAVVGLSDNPERTSHQIGLYLKNHYTIIPVNPSLTELWGLKCYPSISAIPPSTHIDIVNIFRKSEAVLPIVQEAIAHNAGAIWMQQGVVNHDAAALAEAAGIPVVMDACIAVMHRRL